MVKAGDHWKLSGVLQNTSKQDVVRGDCKLESMQTYNAANPANRMTQGSQRLPGDRAEFIGSMIEHQLMVIATNDASPTP